MITFSYAKIVLISLGVLSSFNKIAISVRFVSASSFTIARLVSSSDVLEFLIVLS
jgi:hypothetical protein